VILVFKSRKNIDGIIKGKFTLGADASIATSPMGRQAGASTDLQFKAEILSYSRSRGIFAGVSLEGSALQIDNEYNEGFYGESGITADRIFSDPGLKAPDVAAKFRNELVSHTRMEK
jgi:lipid-binding SYLF domain-containing protein